MTQDPGEGQDGLDNQGFPGNQEDKDNQVISNRDLNERTNILKMDK